MEGSKPMQPEIPEDGSFKLLITYRTSAKVIRKEFTSQDPLLRSIKTVEDLLDYFQRDVLKNKEPLEAFLNSVIVPPDFRISEIQTTRWNPLAICRKFIKNQKTTTVNKGFFTMCKIELEPDIILPKKLQVCIAEIKDSIYQVQDYYRPFIQSYYRKIAKQNECDIHPTISLFLSGSFTEAETTKFQLCGYYPIKSYTDEHFVFPNHVILEEPTQNAIFICEDKKDDMDHAVLQLFDQLITYSLTQKGKQKKYIYGLATSLYRWRFCCYINTSFTNNKVTADNFIVSDEIGIELQDQVPTNTFITNIVQIIRGFITKDVGGIIMQVKLLFTPL